MKESLRIFQKSVLAGFSISLGAVAFLKVGGVVGAVLFTIGLLLCVCHGFTLFTGTAGFVYNKRSLFELFIVLLGNIVGCGVMACVIKECLPEFVESANNIVLNHTNHSWFQTLILSGLCGFIMTSAVYYGKKGIFYVMFFGVPLFILCGFIHSIADAFYILMSSVDYIINNASLLISYYATIVLGNFIGCNFCRIIMLKLDYE